MSSRNIIVCGIMRELGAETFVVREKIYTSYLNGT